MLSINKDLLLEQYKLKSQDEGGKNEIKIKDYLSKIESIEAERIELQRQKEELENNIKILQGTIKMNEEKNNQNQKLLLNKNNEINELKKKLLETESSFKREKE